MKIKLIINILMSAFSLFILKEILKVSTFLNKTIAQSPGAVEYTDFTPAEG